MRVTEDERAELHNANKAGEVENFGIRVSAVEYAGEVEKFGSLVYFCPKPFLQRLLGIFEGGSLFDQVKMGQDADDFGETVCLEDV